MEGLGPPWGGISGHHGLVRLRPKAWGYSPHSGEEVQRLRSHREAVASEPQAAPTPPIPLRLTTQAALVIDLAFVIEGQDEAELPERLLGAVRMHRINLKEERLLTAPAAEDE